MPEQDPSVEPGMGGGDAAPENGTVDVEALNARITELEASENKWKSLSRENEEKWKKATKQDASGESAKTVEPTVDPLETYKTERIRDKARDKFEAFAEALGADLNSVMKHVTVDSFLGEDGSAVLTEEIKAYVERFAPVKKGGRLPQDVGVGPQGGSGAPSIDQRIADAEKAGDRLAVISLKREKSRSNSGK